MDEWAKKKRKPQPGTSSVVSHLSSLSRQVEKGKESELSTGHQKEKRARRESIDVDIGPLSVIFPPKTSLWKNPCAFTPVFPQFVLEEDQPIYERLGEISILERSAQMTLQVSIYITICLV